MRVLCQKPLCSDTAAQEVSAEGTSYKFAACHFHVGWAKEQVQQDMPGRRLVSSYVR